MHYVYNYVTKALIAQTACNHDLFQIKKECERNQVFYYVESFNDEEPITAQSLADDVIAAIDLEDELEALPIEANPNRFIKSSFTLSLLWVAKFYHSLSDSYKRNCKQGLSAWRSSIKPYKLYRHYLGLSMDLMTSDSPNSFRWWQV